MKNRTEIDETLKFEIKQCYKYLISNKQRLSVEFNLPEYYIDISVRGIEPEESLFLVQQDLPTIAKYLSISLDSVKKCWNIYNTMYPISYEELDYYLNTLGYTVRKLSEKKNLPLTTLYTILANYRLEIKSSSYGKLPSSDKIKEIKLLYQYLNVTKSALKDRYNMQIPKLNIFLKDIESKRENIFSKTINLEKIASTLELDIQLVEWAFNNFKNKFQNSYDDLYKLRVTEGKTPLEITEIYGCTSQHIYALLKQMGIPPADVEIVEKQKTINDLCLNEQRELLLSLLKAHTPVYKLVSSLQTSVGTLQKIIESDSELKNHSDYFEKRNLNTVDVVNDNKLQMLQMYFSDGYTIRAIADKFNLHETTLGNHLRPILIEYALENGIDYNRFKNLVNKIPKAYLEREYVANRRSIKDISEELNLSCYITTNNLNFYNIPIRKNG